MSSGFITEAEIEEQRRTRQEEWEKVRKPDEPTEAPEEDYDHRTLFERLEEQRQKKDLEYEESHKLKNMIKGLDDDEVEFLDMVDRTKMEQEKRLQSEEAKELHQFRMKAAALKEQKKKEEETNPKFSSLNESFSSGLTPRNKVLASIVKKRSASDTLPTSPAKKSMTEMNSSKDSNESSASSSINESESTAVEDHPSGVSRAGVMRETMIYPSAMKCVGVLPGIGSYVSDDSSDSERTSGSDLEETPYDLRGQQIKKRAEPAIH